MLKRFGIFYIVYEAVPKICQNADSVDPTRKGIRYVKYLFYIYE